MKTLPPALVALAALSARAQPGPELATPPQLVSLIEQSLAARPELAAAEGLVRAENERIPQAGAMPDPVLQLGIQNDGFSGLELGTEATSFVSIGVSQTFPWPGKLDLAGEIAATGRERASTRAERVRLSTEVEVRRAYLELVLARDRLVLLDRLEALWRQVAGIARTRYEAGEGAQVDMLRAQLELSRLRQRRSSLEAQARAQVQALNRLRGAPLDEPLLPDVHLADLGAPRLAAAGASAARSPELRDARLAIDQARTAAGLARKEYFPDLTVSAAIMPRGGDFPPMWSLFVGGELPAFAGSRQSRAVAEYEARAAAARRAQEEVAQQLALRDAQRDTALASALEVVRLFREGLLVQSQATSQSTLGQYQVGRASFVAVLEANAGQVNDEESYLQALADVQRLGIDALENQAGELPGPGAAPPVTAGRM